MRKGPAVTSTDIFNYFELSLGVDGGAMKYYENNEAYLYLHNGKVGHVLPGDGKCPFFKYSRESQLKFSTF